MNEIIISLVTISTVIFALLVVVLIFLVNALQKRKYRYIRHLEKMTEDFNDTFLRSQLEIQRSIAEEIHDNLGANVSLINLDLARVPLGNPAVAGERIATIKEAVKKLYRDLRDMSAQLNTDRIVKMDLDLALSNEVERIRRMVACDIEFNQSGGKFTLEPPGKSVIIFRICQELLTNALKHAEASLITINLHNAGTVLELTITDNGIGFDTSELEEQPESRMGNGLLNLQNRARLINAELKFFSGSGQGTEVVVTIPLHTKKYK